jgi:hypothetical protein
MSHLYPLAENARAALVTPEPAARSQADAMRLCPPGGYAVARLETEWLTLSADERADLAVPADTGVSAGFVQRYENAQGATVLAVTYWKLVSEKVPAREDPAAPELIADPEPDHTDDLYFRVGRTKKRRRKKPNPNQLDLFGTPDETPT